MSKSSSAKIGPGFVVNQHLLGRSKASFKNLTADSSLGVKNLSEAVSLSSFATAPGYKSSHICAKTTQIKEIVSHSLKIFTEKNGHAVKILSELWKEGIPPGKRQCSGGVKGNRWGGMGEWARDGRGETDRVPHNVVGKRRHD